MGQSSPTNDIGNVRYNTRTRINIECNEIDSNINPQDYSQTLISMINGRKVQTYLDTGSGASLIRHDTLIELTKDCPVIIDNPRISLVTVTGEPLTSSGSVELTISLGKVHMKHDFQVIPPGGRMKPLLLGLDFLSKYDISMHFKHGHILCQNNKVSFLRKHELVPPPCKVSLIDTITLSPRSETIATARLHINSLDSAGEQFSNFDSIFEAGTLSINSVQIAHNVSRATNNEVPVNIANVSDSPVELKEGTVIGKLYPCANIPVGDFYLLESEGESKSTDCANTPEVDYYSLESEGENKRPTMPPVDLSHAVLSEEQLEQVKSLLIEYSDVFATEDRAYGKTDLIQHSINTGDNPPVKHRAYRNSPKIREEINKKCSELLDQGLIEPSDSPWASPVIMVKKKPVGNEPATYRMVLDYRSLNKATLKDSHPVPSLEETIEALGGNQYFSVMDLSAGYHQIPMNPDHRFKTAFTTGTDLYEWTRCPMGLCNAGQTFQRLMEKIFRGLRWSSVVCYMDDIACFAKTFQEKLANLKEVFKRLRDAGLKLSPKKCNFFCTEVNFLGHVVSGKGVSPDPRNIQKVKDWPRPKTQTQVRGFCSLASYYRKFVKGFSEIAAPLNKLTQKEQPFIWDESCESAFHTLKDALTSSPIVAHPDFSMPWLLYCDASLNSIGSVLAQKDTAGREHVIAYFSSSLSKTERKWSTFDREFYAIVKSVRRFRHYLRDSHFTIITDHRPLLPLRKLDLNSDPTGKRTRWALELDPLDFNVIHKSGSKHLNADSLSRYPHPENDVDTNLSVNMVSTIEEARQEQTHAQVNNQSTLSQTSKHHPPTSQSFVRTNHLTQSDNCTNNNNQSGQNTIGENDILCCHSSELLDMQKKDVNIQIAVSWLNDDLKPRFPRSNDQYLLGLWKQRANLRLNDAGLFCRECPTSCQDDAKLQVIIPESYIPQVLHHLHGTPLSGHTSSQTALHLASQHCYWPRMTDDIHEYCTLCESCQKHSNPVPKLKAPLRPIQKPRRSHIAIDITDMPTTPSGLCCILTVTDLFSKYIELYPMSDHTVMSVSKALFDQYIPNHGLPISVHSDRGAVFESQVFQHLMKLCGVTKTRTTSYRPNCNGQTERVHRTIKDHLTRCLQEHGLSPQSWTEVLGQIKLCYNSTMHSSTGFSPYFLEKGEEPLLPIHLLLSHSHVNSVALPRDHQQYVSDLQSRMHAAYKLVQAHSSHCKRLQAHYYDRTIRFNPYETHDLVMLKNERRNTKLTPKWLGPFRIMDRTSDGRNYRIVNASNPSARLMTVHYDKLKPYYVSQLAKQPSRYLMPNARLPLPTLTPQPHSVVKPPTTTITIPTTPTPSRPTSPAFSDLPFDQQSTLTSPPSTPTPDTSYGTLPNLDDVPGNALPPTSSGRQRQLPAKFNDFIMYTDE